MPRHRLRARLPWIIAVTGILALSGLWLARSFVSRDSVKQGWAAYARGDWEIAVERARERLKGAGDDTTALRLLARASVRLGRDSSALAVYDRLGSDAIAPDDLCLMGIALTRSGDTRGVKVWEQALAAEPNHPETLFELTRAYSKSDRLAAAAQTGSRLAERPGWESRAEVLLGDIQKSRNDPDGAVIFWRRAIEHEESATGNVHTPIVQPKELARALLQTRQPVEARLQLDRLLSSQLDPEAFWLLSRAYLQEGEKNKSLAAWEKSGSYRDDHPLVPEPSPFVGSNRCAECHSAVFQSQQSSRHAHTFFRVSELGNITLPPASFPDPGQPKVTHTLRRMNGRQLQQETHVENQVFDALVEYAFGSGDRGLTLVGRGGGGQAFELRLSQYRTGTNSHWDVTSGHILHPSEAVQYLGEPLTDDGVRQCLICHVTDAQAIIQESGPGAIDRGIGCEKCHGPGENHILAIKADFREPAIVDPKMVSGSRVVGLCAQCHSPIGRQTSPEDPSAARFPGTTLTWSRCFQESKDKLDCMTCHDPHRNAATSPAQYEAKCLLCHSGAARSGASRRRSEPTNLAEASEPAACPVNPTEGCVACHMPSVKNVVPHSSFTDHFIRVHRN